MVNSTINIRVLGNNTLMVDRCWLLGANDVAGTSGCAGWVIDTCWLLNFTGQYYWIISLILQMKRLRHREVTQAVNGRFNLRQSDLRAPSRNDTNCHECKHENRNPAP